MAEAEVKFVFSIDTASAVEPAARLWVDVNADGKLLNQEEVGLRRDGLTWSGSVATTTTPLAKVTFYLKYLAPVGAKWNLKVTTETTEGERVLYKAKDVCGFQPSWIAGRLDHDEN